MPLAIKLTIDFMLILIIHKACNSLQTFAQCKIFLKRTLLAKLQWRNVYSAIFISLIDCRESIPFDRNLKNTKFVPCGLVSNKSFVEQINNR